GPQAAPTTPPGAEPTCRPTTERRHHAGTRSQRTVPRSVSGARRRRRDRGRGGGGAVLAPQARQAAGALRRVGAARAGHAVVPAAGRPAPAGPRRRRLLL